MQRRTHRVSLAELHCQLGVTLMKKILLLTSLFITPISFAQMQVLPLSNSVSFGAVFPCGAEKKSVNSQIGVTNALQCSVDNGSSVCVFLTAEQPLDSQSFGKAGFGYIAEVHRQYALQMDKSYRKISEKIVNMGGLGKALIYEIIRNQEGVQVNVKGAWLVANGKLLRGAVSCAPNGTNFMRNESSLFLQSFAIMK